MKAVVAAFNQEKALVGAISVIMNLRMDLFEALQCSHASITFIQLTEVIGRTEEKTELATFLTEVRRNSNQNAYCILMLRLSVCDCVLYVIRNIPKVVTQFKIADTKKFDKTITLEDKLEALR